MPIGIATDHGGFRLKEEQVGRMSAAGHEVVDFGVHNLNPDDDYPDYVVPIAQAVVAGKLNRGIAICGSGEVDLTVSPVGGWQNPTVTGAR
jgi:ribose 5-phosphate isomerase B